eukprot:PhF_6_TR36750/c0_g1_i1/m.54093
MSTFLDRILEHYETSTLSDDIETFLSQLPPIEKPTDPSAGYPHEVHAYFQQFVQIIENNLQSFRMKEGLSEEMFIMQCQKEQQNEDGGCGERGKRIIDSILCGASFDAFVNVVHDYQAEMAEEVE